MQVRDVLVAVLFLLYFVYIALRKTRRKLPPGPPGWPVVGNTFDVPHREPWIQYARLSQRYGSDVVSVKILGNPLILLNSVEAAIALLEKRSNIYSDRWTTELMKMTCLDKLTGMMAYGDSWRAHRRIYHQHLSERTITQYDAQMKRYPMLLAKRLLDSPTDFLSHARWMAGASILNVTYGFDIEDTCDPLLQSADDSLAILNEVFNGGPYLVDFLPALRRVPSWLPGARFKRRALEWKEAVSAMFDTPFNAAKCKIISGTALPSITSKLVSATSRQESEKSYEDLIKSVTGTTYVGGQDTSTATLQTFFLAMVQHPEVQKVAQDELDRVVGTGRLPELEDESQLPFITAVMYEVLRWRPVVPLGVPHRSIRDDEYHGYHIPKGSLVISNIWAILHDKNTYPDPETFNPTRFLNADGTLNPSVPRPDAVFGFGRRICPGRHFALRSLWITIATVLSVFDITKAVDEDGRVIEPSGEYEHTFVIAPVPFKAVFRPRSAAAENMIRSLLAEEISDSG